MRTIFLALFASLALTACTGPTPTDTGSTDNGTDDTAETGDVDTDTDDTPCEERDADEDGVNACDDCDDADPQVYPGAVESCDGVDSDCDGAPHPGEVDEDGDGTLDCAACDAAGFWVATRDGQTGDALEQALRDAMAGDNACVSYSDERSFLFLQLANESGIVEGLYTGETFNVGSSLPDWTVVNTEHVWPQSDGADNEPEKCDLHHLYPTNSDVNSRRGSTPFGVVSNPDWSGGGSKMGNSLFEPRDSVKGDVARAILYFRVRYGDRADVDVNAQCPDSKISLFKQWHNADPPTADDLARSEAVTAQQGFGNPFIACDGLVDRL